MESILACHIFPLASFQIIKVVNEVYHSYNRHQNPFVAINISMDKGWSAICSHTLSYVIKSRNFIEAIF